MLSRAQQTERHPTAPAPLSAADSKHLSKHRIKGLEISQVKILKAQRSLYLAKKAPLRGDVAERKGNDVERIQVTGLGLHSDGKRKETCSLNARF